MQLKYSIAFSTLVYGLLCLCLSSRAQGIGSGNQEQLTIDTLSPEFKALTAKAQKRDAERQTRLGEQTGSIDFKVTTKNLADYPEGIIDYVELSNADKLADSLVNGNEIVIEQHKITIIIDYPLERDYQFTLESPKGFTRAQLVKAISRHYAKLYREEEDSAKKKTLPLKQRTSLNRNRTDGKYGIWGHDLSDLVLTSVEIYRNAKGEIGLMLDIDS